MKTYEYYILPDVDCLNGGENQKINAMAREGWEPHMVVGQEALGLKTAFLLRREVKPPVPRPLTQEEFHKAVEHHRKLLKGTQG